MMWNLLKHIEKERSNTLINYKIVNDNYNLRYMSCNARSWEIQSSKPTKVYQTYFKINKIPTFTI